MKVFISWSGEGAYSVAEALRSWLPSVIHPVEPFLSSTDIRVGRRSMVELDTALQNAGAAIVCLTRSNLDAPWINFEVGAISARVNSPVCTLLLGVSSHDVSGPLSQFQHASTGMEDVKRLIFSINDALSANNERPVPRDALVKSFDAFWPKLEQELSIATGPSRIQDLRGVWQTDHERGGFYYINQSGEDVWWLGEQTSSEPQWCNIAWGRIDGKVVRLRWGDVPKGRINSDGTLVLKIVDHETLEAVGSSGGFAAKRWMRRYTVDKLPFGMSALDGPSGSPRGGPTSA
jgi:hypothetical protein